MLAPKMAKWGSVISSAAFCSCGILLMIHPDTSINFLCSFMGVLLTIYGIIKIIGYFSKDLYRLAFQFDLAAGLLFFAVGLVMLVHPEGIIAFLHMVIGIIVTADGLFKIQIAIDSRRFGLSKWWLTIVISILVCGFGLLLIIYPFKGGTPGMTLTGAALLFEGILNLHIAIYTVKIQKKKTKIIKKEDEND